MVFESLLIEFIYQPIPCPVHDWPLAGSLTVCVNGGAVSDPAVYSGIARPFFCINSCNKPTGFWTSSGSMLPKSRSDSRGFINDGAPLVWLKKCKQVKVQHK